MVKKMPEKRLVRMVQVEKKERDQMSQRSLYLNKILRVKISHYHQKFFLSRSLIIT